MSRRHWYVWRCIIPGCRWQGRCADGLDAFREAQEHYRQAHHGRPA